MNVFFILLAFNSNLQSRSCTCQCHQSTCQTLTSNSTNDYFIFEQALRQTRQEHQETIQNNQLIQILKDQHQELMKLYHRQLHMNKIDRGQQTNELNQHDQIVQTDMSTLTQPNHTPNQVKSNESFRKLKNLLIVLFILANQWYTFEFECKS